MKKVLKVMMILVLVAFLLIAGILLLLYHTLQTGLGDTKDFKRAQTLSGFSKTIM